MSPAVRSGSFKLAKASGGVCLFARVEVEVPFGQSGPKSLQIPWMEMALRWNGNVCQPGPLEREAIQRGVMIALQAYHEAINEVRICKVDASYADTNEDCLTFAACFAVWNALQICGCTPPRLENRRFHFPENP